MLAGKKVLVLGLGVSGKSAMSFLLKMGADVTGVDSKKEVLLQPEVVALKAHLFHDLDFHDMETIDLLVISPGIPKTHPLYQKALELGIEIIGEIELACRYLKGKCVAITGTNGKTTVTLLVEHILKQAGIHAKALGNMGVPLTSELLLDSTIDVYVLELSSYQLETMQAKIIDAAVILNITPDHLDRYDNMDEYAKAKIHIKECLKKEGVLFVEDRCYQEFKPLFQECVPFTYGYSEKNWISSDLVHLSYQHKIEAMLPSELRKKSHDLENTMAAYALCRTLNVSPDLIMSGLTSFKKPSHRIQYVKTLNGIHFYDDSKGTNIDAVIRAVDAVEGPIILIAGGVEKGFPYTSWIKSFKDKVHLVCAIGQARENIKKDLSPHIEVMFFNTLEEATHYAYEKSEPGQTVLLSPGCSSFDMFKDYAHRGKEFQRVVNQLTEKKVT